MPKDRIELKLPDWALCALVNDDYSGLTDSDSAEIIRFKAAMEKAHGPGYITVDTETDYGFCKANSINALGTNCYAGYYNINH